MQGAKNPLKKEGRREQRKGKSNTFVCMGKGEEKGSRNWISLSPPQVLSAELPSFPPPPLSSSSENALFSLCTSGGFLCVYTKMSFASLYPKWSGVGGEWAVAGFVCGSSGRTALARPVTGGPAEQTGKWETNHILHASASSSSCSACFVHLLLGHTSKQTHKLVTLALS